MNSKITGFIAVSLAFGLCLFFLWDVYLFYILFFGGMFILSYLITPIEWVCTKIKDFAEGKHLD